MHQQEHGCSAWNTTLHAMYTHCPSPFPVTTYKALSKTARIRLSPFLVVHFPNILLPPFFRCDCSDRALVSGESLVFSDRL